jgi:hypothetical protein
MTKCLTLDTLEKKEIYFGSKFWKPKSMVPALAIMVDMTGTCQEHV